MSGRRESVAGVLMVACLGFAGCVEPNPQADAMVAKQPAVAAPVNRSAAPPGSRFAQLHKGMSMDEVAAAIGNATASDGHVMGKAFNPFYFGKDRYRRTWYYAGEGRLIFNIDAKLLKAIPDPSEDGYPPASYDTPTRNVSS